jgi:uncharacterized integral membrane protein
MQKGLIISLVIAILLVVFALQNAEEVIIKFFGWEKPIPVVLLILVSALIGMIVSVVLSISNTSKLKQEKKDLEKRISELEERLPSETENSDEGEIIEGETKHTFFDE